MFIWTAKFSRKKAVAAVLCLGVLLCACIIVVSRGGEKKTNEALTCTLNCESEEQRLSLLQQLGWNIQGGPVETLNLVLPSPLDEEYLQYNQLQQKQGLDLLPYAGRSLCRYTYIVTNYPGLEQGVQANLYVCDGTLVAGDIFYGGSGGFVRELVFPEKAD